MSRYRRHTLVVEIFCEALQGQRQAQDRVHRWLETHGHTAPAFGFEFRACGVLTGKHINPKTPERKLDGRRSHPR